VTMRSDVEATNSRCTALFRKERVLVEWKSVDPKLKRDRSRRDSVPGGRHCETATTRGQAGGNAYPRLLRLCPRIQESGGSIWLSLQTPNARIYVVTPQTDWRPSTCAEPPGTSRARFDRCQSAAHASSSLPVSRYGNARRHSQYSISVHQPLEWYHSKILRQRNSHFRNIERHASPRSDPILLSPLK
jgi:hypothetical protein